jgi:hypothetical protein
MAIASKMPKFVDDYWKEKDVQHNQLIKDSNETGIEAKLLHAKKAYFALSPSPIGEGSEFKSKHKVMYWLNPVQQDVYNSGHFTVEDLEKWILEKGPIMKDKRTR